MQLSAAEKKGFVDGAIVFLGGLGVSGGVAASVPSAGIGISEGLVVSSLIAGAIAGLNSRP